MAGVFIFISSFSAAGLIVTEHFKRVFVRDLGRFDCFLVREKREKREESWISGGDIVNLISSLSGLTVSSSGFASGRQMFTYSPLFSGFFRVVITSLDGETLSCSSTVNLMRMT